MTTARVEAWMRKILEHPRRRWFVIIVTCLVSVVAVLPAVDNYNASTQRKAQLAERLRQAEQTAARLSTTRQQVDRLTATAADWERRSMNDDRIHQFRNELVALARQCSCGLRRIRLGEPRQREWFQTDNPLALRPAGPKLERTPFVLRQRTLSLSVTGSLANVTRLLEALGRQERLVHCSSLVLQRSEEDTELVVLELELELFELARSEPVRSA
ncbi:MAG: hypothetical protein KatS3mg110_0760 [Pirellulaceae bacterium]|nr:MAG: hypothetical protein KatS3mg110_0760 [Pirellulaceae bacterium]